MTQPASSPQRATVAVIGLGSIGGVVAGCLRRRRPPRPGRVRAPAARPASPSSGRRERWR